MAEPNEVHLETHEPEIVYVIVKRIVDKLKKEAGIDG